MYKRIMFAAILLGAIILGIFFVLKTRHIVSVTPLVTYDATTTSAVIHMLYPTSSSTTYPEIHALIDKVQNDFTAEYGNLTPEQIRSQYGRDNVQFNLYVSTKVATSTKTVSYIIYVYEYTGGAHGGTSVHTFTYDRAGKLITLQQVFTQEYLQTVARLAKEYVMANLGQYSQPEMVEPGVAPTAENFNAWYLTEDTITFIFQEYQVGPYAMGIQEFPLPKKQVESILHPTYKAGN